MHCVGRVQKALDGIEGVKAQVDLASKSAQVTVSDGITDAMLSDAVTEAGYDVIQIKEGA
jgi:copper chaperone CopZ